MAACDFNLAADLSLAAALQAGAAAGLPRLEAQMLLLAALGREPHDRAWLLTHDQEPLNPSAAQTFNLGCQRRLAGEPVAYILGRKAFYGLELCISPAVLDPRDDTETLVDWALELLPAEQPLRVLDLGTGSGAIALAIQAQRPKTQLYAIDASPAALELAQTNAQRLGLGVQFLHGSWFSPVAGQRFDLIVSNPPYIPAQDPHLAALLHEPLSALASGEDGLDDIRQIIAAAPAHLQAGGHVLLEHGFDQALAVAGILAAAGFTNIQQRQDLAGHIRCTGGKIAA